MKVLLLNDSSSNPNWGDRAAATALKRMIVAKGGALHSVFTEDDLIQSRYGNPESPPERDAVGATGSRRLKDWARLFLPPVVLGLRERVLRRLRSVESDGPLPRAVDDFARCADLLLRDRERHGRLLSALEDTDLVVVHGDGCMVGMGVLPRAELFLGYLAKTRFGKPTILINHTTDLSHPELNRMAEDVYPLLDDVTYRDRTSEDLCRGRWPGRYAADTAFLFEPAPRDAWIPVASRPTYFDVWPDEASFDPAKPFICIGGSSIYSFDTPPRVFGEAFGSLVSHLRKTYSGQIVLTASDAKDETIFRPVARELRLPLVGLSIPVQQAVDILGNAQAYVGGRWHPSIFALRGGTPVIPLSSKTFKMRSLVGMAGLPTATFDALDLPRAKEGIGRTLLELVARGEGLRGTLRRWAAGEASGCWDNLAFLASLERSLAGGTSS